MSILLYQLILRVSNDLLKIVPDDSESVFVVKTSLFPFPSKWTGWKIYQYQTRGRFWHRFHIGYWISISTHPPCSILLFEIEPSFWIWMKAILWRNSRSRFHYFSFIRFWSGLISNLSLIFRVNRPIFFFSLNIPFLNYHCSFCSNGPLILNRDVVITHIYFH